MKYLTHTVYVVTNAYPTISTDLGDLVREARISDVGSQKLGVLQDGKVVPLSDFEVTDVAKHNGSPLERAVRVRYSKDGDGWSYSVLAADSLTWLGSGWSAGKKSDAQSDFRHRAAREGWLDVGTRQARMKGAA